MTVLERHADEHCLRLEFLPLLELVDKVGGEVRRFLQERGFQADMFPLELVSREAVTNALIHGSGLSPSRPVRYEMELGADSVSITVTDGGDGWDWKKYCCRLPSESEEAGRGLFIINSYADSVEFNEKGNRIRIRMRLSGREESK